MSMTLGIFMRNMRREKGKTLKDIATLAGISISYLSDIERGRTDPSLKTLNKLSQVLNFSTAYLLEYSNTLSEDEARLLYWFQKGHYRDIINMILDKMTAQAGPDAGDQSADSE